MIRNPDGTPYVLQSTLQTFNPTSPDHAFFNQQDNDLLKISGSPCFYYEVHFGDIDPLYLEDRDKIFSSSPIQFYGIYEPPEQTEPSGMFGIDSPDDEIQIECNYRTVVDTIGHVPVRGSRIFTPHRQENWIIVDVKLAEFKSWGILHLKLICKKFTESTTDSSGSMPQPMPDVTITNLPNP